MNFNEYQQLAAATAQYPQDQARSYLALGLASEAGEVAGKVSKWIRGDCNWLDLEEIALELGDNLWFIAMLAEELGYTLEQIAEMNIQKLRDRQERGVIKGDGDVR